MSFNRASKTEKSVQLFVTLVVAAIVFFVVYYFPGLLIMKLASMLIGNAAIAYWTGNILLLIYFCLSWNVVKNAMYVSLTAAYDKIRKYFRGEQDMQAA